MDEKINQMDILELVDRCMNEIDNFRHGKPTKDEYGLELFRRAIQEYDPFAWEIIELHFTEIMLQWMKSHPLRYVAHNHESDENYIAQAFTRFWQATAGNDQIHFTSLAAILRYLRASLNGIILDTLRGYSRQRETSFPVTGSPGEPMVEDRDDGNEVWEVIQGLLSDERQRRVAYLLYHCGLKPRQIIQYCSPEFSDIQEIYRLRRSIFERLQRNADYIRWRLDY